MKEVLNQMFFSPPAGGNDRGVAISEQFTGLGGQNMPSQDFKNGADSATNQVNRSAQAGGAEMRNIRRHQYVVANAQTDGRTLYQDEAIRDGDARPEREPRRTSTAQVKPQYQPPNYSRTPRSDGRPSGR